MENAEVLNDFLASAFTSESSSLLAQAPESKGRDRENEELTTVGDHV